MTNIHQLRLHLMIFLLPAVLLACTLSPVPFATDDAPPTTQTTAATATRGPLPTASPATLPVTPTTAAAEPPSPAAAPVDFDDLTPHRAAMRPGFVTDVERVVASGAAHYIINVEIEPASFEDEAGLRLWGTEHIRYTNTESASLNDIYFRLYPNLPGYGGQMQVEAAEVDGRAVQPVPAAEGTAIRLPLPEPLSPGEQVALSLDFSALVPTQTQAGYNIFSYTNDTAALAGFYPALAVYDEAGWHLEIPPAYGDATYLDIALFQVQLTVPSEMVVAASGSLWTEQDNNNDTKTLAFASGPMRDFYIAMRPDYSVTQTTIDGIIVNSYYPPEVETGGKLALQYAIDSLRVFNDRFGPYPYAEFDVVATPTTAGGVEYPGIVVAAERAYRQEGGFFQHIIGHEVAHQWWYALVGNNQIEEPWLDESLTNYSTAIYWETVEGDATAVEIIDSLFVDPYESAVEQNRDRAVVGPVSDFTFSQYSALVYGKGALFFHALRQEVGDEVYFEIMQTYYERYKYKIADGDDLFAVIEEVSGQDVQPLVDRWLLAP